MANECIVKYINLRDMGARLHEPCDFEFASARIRHSSFEELHQKVFGACPLGYRCVEPIALRHEVLWSLGLNVLRDKDGNRVCERDELVHAIEEAEYKELLWKQGKPLSICVDVIEAHSFIAFGAMLPASRPLWQSSGGLSPL